MIKYVEHKIWFLGHTFSEEGLKKSKNYSFNMYSESGEKVIFNETESSIFNQLNGIYSDCGLICEKINYNFLNNGCISILVEYSVTDKENIFLHNYDTLSGKKFMLISSILFDRLELLIEKDLSKDLILNNYMRWGVPNLLIKKENDRNNYNELNMNSVLYTQSFIFDESEKEIFEEEINNLLKNKITSDSYDLYIDWGKRFFNIKKDKDISDTFQFFDSEIVYLSKKVMTISQLNIFTHLSQKILYDENIRNSISVEDLELLVSSYRTLFQLNELISQDFDEFTNKFNKICFSTENFKELLDIKINSEITLIQLANYHESKRNEKSNNRMNTILLVITLLTIYSVVNDVFSFLPLDEEKPIQISRIIVISLLTIALFFGFNNLKKSKLN